MRDTNSQQVQIEGINPTQPELSGDDQQVLRLLSQVSGGGGDVENLISILTQNPEQIERIKEYIDDYRKRLKQITDNIRKAEREYANKKRIEFISNILGTISKIPIWMLKTSRDVIESGIRGLSLLNRTVRGMFIEYPIPAVSAGIALPAAFAGLGMPALLLACIAHVVFTVQILNRERLGSFMITQETLTELTDKLSSIYEAFEVCINNSDSETTVINPFDLINTLSLLLFGEKGQKDFLNKVGNRIKNSRNSGIDSTSNVNDTADTTNDIISSFLDMDESVRPKKISDFPLYSSVKDLLPENIMDYESVIVENRDRCIAFFLLCFLLYALTMKMDRARINRQNPTVKKINDLFLSLLKPDCLNVDTIILMFIHTAAAAPITNTTTTTTYLSLPK